MVSSLKTCSLKFKRSILYRFLGLNALISFVVNSKFLSKNENCCLEILKSL